MNENDPKSLLDVALEVRKEHEDELKKDRIVRKTDDSAYMKADAGADDEPEELREEPAE